MSGLSSVTLANIPSPDQGIWRLDIGSLSVPVRAYAICIIVGIVVAIWWTERRLVARGGQPGTAVDVAVWAVPFGMIGGRLYHVMTDWTTYFGEGGSPAKALAIWQGGLGVWGAIALGAVGGWIGCRRRGVPLRVFADAAAPGIVVAQAIGRLGNWFNQELFGGETTLPWGLEIYQRINSDTGALDNLGGIARDSVPIAVVHPTFLYELLWNFGVAAMVVVLDRRYRMGHGRVFALYVAAYTFGRFFIEAMRTDPVTMFLGFRFNLTTSALLFAGAVAYLILVRGGRETIGEPPDDAGDAEPDESAIAQPIDSADADTEAADTADATDVADTDATDNTAGATDTTGGGGETAAADVDKLAGAESAEPAPDRT